MSIKINELSYEGTSDHTLTPNVKSIPLEKGYWLFYSHLGDERDKHIAEYSNPKWGYICTDIAGYTGLFFDYKSNLDRALNYAINFQKCDTAATYEAT